MQRAPAAEFPQSERAQEAKEADTKKKPNTAEDIMSNRIHELLHRNLQEVFGEGDATRRRAAITELYTEDFGVYVGPGKFVGREALDKFAGDLRATDPHFVYTPRGEPQALQNAAGRLARGSGPQTRVMPDSGWDLIL